jgi:hypothetical protein
MDTELIEKELDGFKADMCEIDLKIRKELEETKDKYKFFFQADQLINDEVLGNKSIDDEKDVITLNIGGKKFSVRLHSLLHYKDSLFYVTIHNFIKRGISIFEKEIFIDREATYFHYILDFIKSRNGNVPYKTNDKVIY